ncbi:MAG: divalent-cation tolerance protein CutA [Thermoplasmata archaeon]
MQHEFEGLTLFYVPIGSMEDARRVSRILIEEALAACVNIIPGTSIYKWEGKITEEPEFYMVIKTKKILEPEVAARLKEIHPYKVPCIIRLHPAGVNIEYMDWLLSGLR